MAQNDAEGAVAEDEEGEGNVENRNERKGKRYSLYKIVNAQKMSDGGKLLTFNGSHDNSQHRGVCGGGDAGQY